MSDVKVRRAKSLAPEHDWLCHGKRSTLTYISSNRRGSEVQDVRVVEAGVEAEGIVPPRVYVVFRD